MSPMYDIHHQWRSSHLITWVVQSAGWSHDALLWRYLPRTAGAETRPCYAETRPRHAPRVYSYGSLHNFERLTASGHFMHHNVLLLRLL